MEQELIYLFLGMALVTYLPRMLPLVCLSRIQLPPVLLRWLSYMPAAVMASLLAPLLFAPEGSLHLQPDNYYLLAAVPCFLVALKYKSLFATVSVGILAMMALQALG